MPALKDQSFSLRLALTCFLLMIGAGYGISLLHLVHHTGAKDSDPGLSMTDVVGTYHGVDKPPPLLSVLHDGSHQAWLASLPKTAAETLSRWLSEDAQLAGAGAIQARYDEPAPGTPEDQPVPSEILEDHCARCHSPAARARDGVVPAMSLARWPDVRRFAFAKKLDPVSAEILTTSSHTHFLAIPAYTLLVASLFFLTRWRRGLRDAVTSCTFVALLAEFACWWLSRSHALFAFGIVGFGAAYGAGLACMLLLTLADLWLPSKAPTRAP